MFKVQNITMLILVLAALFWPIGANADSFPKCFVGTYFIEEGSGTKSLWTLGALGTIIVTSSSQEALNFSTEHGSWEKSARKQARSTMLDFSFGDNGELTSIARIDAIINFIGRNCDEVGGEFTLRFFEPDQNPLNPEESNEEPVTDSFTGRRVEAK